MLYPVSLQDKSDQFILHSIKKELTLSDRDPVYFLNSRPDLDGTCERFAMYHLDNSHPQSLRAYSASYKSAHTCGVVS